LVTAFENSSLPADLANRILISPLSAFEVLAQLAGDDGDVVLQQIHAIHNWTNPQHSGLLPWPDDMLFQLWFHKLPADDGFTKKMQDSFNVCLSTESVATLKAEAEQHKQVMDNFKENTAQHFKDMLTEARKEKKKHFDMTEAWFRGIANRIHAAPKSRKMSEIVSALSAYHEFEESKLQMALTTPQYNPLSKTNRNDIFDAEQLVYLGDKSLCLLTCDKGFRKRVKKSEQARRLITATREELIDAKKAEALLRKALGDEACARPRRLGAFNGARREFPYRSTRPGCVPAPFRRAGRHELGRPPDHRTVAPQTSSRRAKTRSHSSGKSGSRGGLEHASGVRWSARRRNPGVRPFRDCADCS
jgi:hypothetical protein